MRNVQGKRFGEGAELRLGERARTTGIPRGVDAAWNFFCSLPEICHYRNELVLFGAVPLVETVWRRRYVGHGGEVGRCPDGDRDRLAIGETR